MRTLPLNDPDVLHVRDRERRMLVRAWGGTPRQQYIGMRDPQYFMRAYLRAGDVFQPVGRFPLTRAFALRHSDDEIPSQCWVATDEKYYRTIYHRYLKQYLAFPRDARLPSTIAIDHVLNRSFARELTNQRYLLVTMVDSEVNSAFGAVYETNSAANALAEVPASDFGGVIIPPGKARTIKFDGEAYNVIWPLMIKAFADRAPAARVSDRYILSVIARLHREGMLSSELDQQYAAMAIVFRRGERNRPHYDAAGRLHPSQTLIGGRLLTPDMSLRNWLNAYFAELGDVALI